MLFITKYYTYNMYWVMFIQNIVILKAKLYDKHKYKYWSLTYLENFGGISKSLIKQRFANVELFIWYDGVLKYLTIGHIFGADEGFPLISWPGRWSGHTSQGSVTLVGFPMFHERFTATKDRLNYRDPTCFLLTPIPYLEIYLLLI